MGNKQRKKIILMPGRLTSWKGQELFIEAINLTKIELGYEAFHVVILGSDQGRNLYKKKLIRLIEQYRLTNQIKFIEHCDDMALAYKVSDIVVSASIEPEAFGRVAVEAQSMEKIIIASDIGGSNETIINEKTGLLFESGDANSLSKKIIKAITMDETSIELIGKEGRKNIIKKFNVEKMCFSTYSEYKRLLN
jgi:glycosyltransferase involved in cell wall biosynthesis